MAQQTAVDWLVNQLQEGRATFFKLNDKEEKIITLAGKDVLEQAKAMEKEQIMNAYQDGKCNSIIGFCSKNESKQYYNETYNK
jgi:hypothetical protein